MPVSGQRGRSPDCPQYRAYGSVHGSSCKTYQQEIAPQSIGRCRSSHSLLQSISMVCTHPCTQLRCDCWLAPFRADLNLLVFDKHQLPLTCSTLRLQLLLLSQCFTLNHVTMISSASSFTTTTASSAGPRFITLTLLSRLELKESQLFRLKSTALHWVR